eukprot:10138815-Karenia_brevis.AAC.1
MQEVANGSMGPDLTEPGVLKKYGPFWNACQRFGIQQGWNDDGSPKFRCIDNEATSGCNEASERFQKISTTSISTIMLMTAALQRRILERGLSGPH